MSRIYFHSQHGEAEIRGSERAWMGMMVKDLFHLSLGLLHAYDTPSERSPLRRVIAADHFVFHSPSFLDSLKLHIGVAMNTPLFVIDGEPVDTFTAQLNTAMLIGGDAIRLCARLHGQCEIHAYVEGPNRGWLAGIIEQGRASEILREDQGWEALVDFLKVRDDEPVVTSYSVCDQFPDPDYSTWKPEDSTGAARDKWYDLSHEDQWRFGMERLRAEPLMEMKPDNWGDYYWRHGVSGFDIRRAANEKEREVRAQQEVAKAGRKPNDAG